MIIIFLLLCITHTLYAQEQPMLENQPIVTSIIDWYIKNNNSTLFMHDCATNQELRQFLYDIHASDESIRKTARNHLHTLIHDLKTLHKKNNLAIKNIHTQAQKEYGNFAIMNAIAFILLICNIEIIKKIIPSLDNQYLRYWVTIPGLASIMYTFEYFHKNTAVNSLQTMNIETEKILQFLYNYDATYFE